MRRTDGNSNNLPSWHIGAFIGILRSFEASLMISTFKVAHAWFGQHELSDPLPLKTPTPIANRESCRAV